MRKKVTLKEMLSSQIIIAILIAIYYWCWARNDWKDYYVTIQNTVGILAFFIFIGESMRMSKYKKEVKDEMAMVNLRKSDSICFKVLVGLIILTAFLSAILKFKISSEIIGYILVGIIVFISIVRVILFYNIDKKGI